MKKHSFFKVIIIMIIIIYISLYYVANSGYYEFHLQEKTVLTNNKIKEFEEDIKNNSNIDIKDYLVYEDVDYSNKITDLMYELSNGSTMITRKIMKALVKQLSYLIEE